MTYTNTLTHSEKQNHKDRHRHGLCNTAIFKEIVNYKYIHTYKYTIYTNILKNKFTLQIIHNYIHTLKQLKSNTKILTNNQIHSHTSIYKQTYLQTYIFKHIYKQTHQLIYILTHSLTSTHI